MKAIADMREAPSRHWVGDGFPVRSLFSHPDDVDQLTPFLMLDYAGPADFDSTDDPRGVGEHPHAGFETVTIVYQGEVAHRDSTGEGGVIGPGDVQWMTAGEGILHEEFHSPEFARDGGTLEMVQLWVNLPSKHKQTEPGYQALRADDIPTVELLDEEGHVRVIAGEFQGQSGPAETYSPMNVWDVRLNAGVELEFETPEGWTTALVTLDGTVVVNDTETCSNTGVVIFERDGRRCSVKAEREAKLLVLSGHPIDEPVAARGPFVMNTREELSEVMQQFQAGTFGAIE